MKFTTEIQRNVKLLHLLNEKIIFFNAIRGKIKQFRAKMGHHHITRCWGVCLRTALKLFSLKMEPDFLNFSLKLDFQDFQNETLNKIKKKNDR